MEAKIAPIIHEKDCKYISVGFQIVEAPKIKTIKIEYNALICHPLE